MQWMLSIHCIYTEFLTMFFSAKNFQKFYMVFVCWKHGFLKKITWKICLSIAIICFFIFISFQKFLKLSVNAVNAYHSDSAPLQLRCLYALSSSSLRRTRHITVSAHKTLQPISALLFKGVKVPKNIKNGIGSFWKSWCTNRDLSVVSLCPINDQSPCILYI